jgi:penicillin-binding protein 1A
LPRFGLARPFPRDLSIALGSAEMTLLELVRAYNVFASGGRLYDPIFILKVVDADGRVLEERRPAALRTLSRQTAYLVTSMLEDVVERGTGRGARELGRPIGGKTGTTNDMRDAWFVGFTPRLVAGVWVGFDIPRTLGPGETGARAALPIWRDFMSETLRDRPVADFSIPDDIVFVNIDPRTGERAAPGATEMRLESFREGKQPRSVTGAAAKRAAQFFRGDF